MLDRESNLTQDQAFEVLGIPSGATLREVTVAYRALASKYHPDRVGHMGNEFQALARTKMAAINQAYELISRLSQKSSAAKSQRKPNSRQAKKHTAADACNSSQSKDADPNTELLRFPCPCCKHRISVSNELRGKKGQCTQCRQLIIVPTHAEVRCVHCARRNRLPVELKRKRAICRQCYGSLERATLLRLTSSV